MPMLIPFDLDELDRPRKGEVKGVDVLLYASPYDLPDEAAREYDSNRKILTLRLRYMGRPERLKTFELDDAKLRVGTETGRVYEVVVGPVDDSEVAFRQAMEALTEVSSPNRGNANIVSAALKQKRASLFDLSLAE